MKDSLPQKAFLPSDETIETMLSNTTAEVFSLPANNQAFLQRMLVISKVSEALPAGKAGPLVASIQGGGLGPAGFTPIKKSLTVGRSRRADWQVEDSQKKLSSCHFSISQHGQKYVLTDLDSSNGTRVNESPARIKQCFIHHGDFIHAGGFTFMVFLHQKS
ncbi:FHA domain-containing protein [Roseimicrobium gellanilyticum]|uniref:FHA domain-containing protein n=1 Tax=Roseimicrobium gellanilyticum TaxID=748857 RepID=A0A366HHZ7_9BACT|nr:FHA domain-containing protein [Roseimicrobium gellanilyticum]RBP41229.1 FHA domain-containing protein [Roseimicrobium gellanilyticum]